MRSNGFKVRTMVPRSRSNADCHHRTSEKKYLGDLSCAQKCSRSNGAREMHFPALWNKATFWAFAGAPLAVEPQADIEKYASQLRECGNSRDILIGKSIHADIVRSGYHKNRFLCNLLVQMYGRCGWVEDARVVFNGISERNVFSWNIMLAQYAQNGHCREALHVFRLMCAEGTKPDQFTLNTVFAACSSLGALEEGEAIHALLEDEDESNVVGNALLSMYGKCGSLSCARRVFEKIGQKDVVTWNALIAANAQYGENKQAIELFHLMDLEGVIPDDITFMSILSSCSLVEGEKLHARIVNGGFDSGAFVRNALVHMYGKCGRLDLVIDTFNRMRQRDVVSWNTVIAACTQNGHYKEAVSFYQKMDHEGVKPDVVTMNSILDACLHLETLDKGEQIHQRLASSTEFHQVDGIGIALVNMYGKHGRLDEARCIFDRIREKDVIGWNTLIAAYTQEGDCNTSITLYQDMLLEGIQPNEITFVSVLDSCASILALTQGRMIHNHAIAGGCELNLVVSNTLIHMYGNCGILDAARGLFDRMNVRDVVSWSAMIAAYAQHGHSKEAIELFQRMDMEGVRPNHATIVSVLDASAGLEDAVHGKTIHKRIVDGGFLSTTGNSLMNMHTKLGCLDDARSTFDLLRFKDVVSWTTMIVAYAHHEHGGKEALALYRRMNLEGVKLNAYTAAGVVDACTSLGDKAEGRAIHARIRANGFESDDVVGTALMVMYCKAGNLEEARKVFDGLPGNDVITWTMMVAAYAQHGHIQTASEVYRVMNLQGIQPNSVTFITILSACSHSGVPAIGRDYFMSMVGDHSLEQTAEHYGCLIDLLGRAGRLHEAEDLINNMPFEPTAFMWVILLAGCKMHNDVSRGARIGEHVFELDRESPSTYVMLSSMFST